MVSQLSVFVMRILLTVVIVLVIPSTLSAQKEVPESKFGLFTVNLAMQTTFEAVAGGGGIGLAYQHRFFRNFSAEIDLGIDFYLYDDEFNINFPKSNQVKGTVFLPQSCLIANYILPIGSSGSTLFVGAGLGAYSYSANASYIELEYEQIDPNRWQLYTSEILLKNRIDGGIKPYWSIQMGADVSFGEKKLQSAGVFIRYNAINYLKPMDSLSKQPDWQKMPNPSRVDMSGLEFGVNFRFWLYGKNN